MKNLFISVIPLIMLIAGCAGSASPAASGMTLDQAIAEAAIQIDNRIASGAKIAPLNFNSPSELFSTYVLDELTANLVDSGNLIVVDRSEIDLIRSEFDFQYSGEVSDDSMQALGQMLGAQSIISGSLTELGRTYRLVIRVLNVQNASVEVQYRADIISDSRVTALLRGSASGTAQTSVRQASSSTGATSSGTASSSTTTGTGQTAQQTQSAVQQSVTTVEGASLANKFEWLEANARRNTNYLIEVTANETIIPQTLSYSGRNNVNITIVGVGGQRTLSLSGSGMHFTIEAGVTMELRNITLQGRDRNNSALVWVNGGAFILGDGAKITGNRHSTSTGTGGVYVDANSRFIMRGGEIFGHTGIGVSVQSNANFIMENGEIYGNTGGPGGGVHVWGGSFTMRGGEIFGNTATSMGGGGVAVLQRGNFIMEGGEISGNTVRGINVNGGGVFLSSARFRMTGGSISGNRYPRGGGVFLGYDAQFTKTGGTIFGFTEGDSNSNTATNGNDHAVGGHRFRNTTAGPRVNLNSATTGAAGGWEN